MSLFIFLNHLLAFDPRLQTPSAEALWTRLNGGAHGNTMGWELEVLHDLYVYWFINSEEYHSRLLAATLSVDRVIYDHEIYA